MEIIQQNDILVAFLLTMIAGLSTGIGSFISLLSKRTNTHFLSIALGLSAGVMIYVSFMELMPESVTQFSEIYDEKLSNLYMLIGFFGGIGLIALIDRLVPEDENPHEVHLENEMNHVQLKRTGIMMAMAIAIHNFPEGLATFATALTSHELAIPIVIAIAIHNIPEGVAVSVPIYHATGSKKKAFWYSFLSGMAEPVGALLGILFLLPFWTPEISATLLSVVSGIMVYISFDELLPATEKFGHHHLGILGIVIGMMLMAGSLYVMG